MKLLSIHLPAERPKCLGLVREIDLRHPTDPVLGWIIAVRGPAIVLIAPADSPHAGGWEFARAACAPRWDSSSPADYDKIGNWTSEPLRRSAPGEEQSAAKAQPGK